MRLVLRIFLALVLVVAFAAAAGYAWLRQSLPQFDGTVALTGLKAPVEIVRDRYGVPHIHASSVEDAQFGLGFAHAQDRLWQMEMNRRIGSGRLSEALGAATLDADKFLRTLGVRRAAEATLKSLSPEARAQLDAYAAGVNAFLAQRSGPLPPEFLLTGIKPEPWDSADCVAWTKMIAWDLGGNWRSELLRLRLAKKLSTAQIGEFLPPYPGDAPLAIADYSALYRQLDASKLAALALPGMTDSGDTYTINVGRNSLASESAPFASRHAASLRAIYDLADLDQSMSIHSTGQSGNLLSPLYRNFAEPWSRAEYIPMSMKRSDAAAGSLGTLRLQPR